MPDLPWLERVRDVASRHGLPPEYADRLVRELADHAEDLAAHATPAERLGDADAVALTAVAAYRAGRFAGRRPVVCFVVAPLIGSLLAWHLYLVLGVTLVESLEGVGRWLTTPLSHVLVVASRFLIPALVTLWLWRVHRDSGRPLGWYAAGALAVTALAGLYFIEFTPPGEGVEADVVVELTLAASRWQAAQAGATFALAVALAWRGRPTPPVLAAA